MIMVRNALSSNYVLWFLQSESLIIKSPPHKLLTLVLILAGYSSFPQWLDGTRIQCTGDELILADCAHSGWGNTLFYSNFQDLAVICSDVSESDGKLG